ncbi:hypothetical protein BDZ94DRAFT_1366452 [Collybia nuda]|uniref:BTB domain-containing protein n=1 Tax=Collybia nuda TaxID=64659 RepID=A0A9P5XTL6_9AGAR|nr:hypothetical protein BDZ94DRAFT_1366452 [Collybia nuda]
MSYNPSLFTPPPNSNEDEETHIRENFNPLFFQDGNIILKSQNVGIRVHRSVLEMHSRTLKTIFENNPTCPADSRSPPTLFIDVTDWDLVHYINAVYNRSRDYFMVRPQAFDITASLIRSSRVLHNDFLRVNTIKRLHNEYPTKIANWDSIKNSEFTRICKVPGLHIEVVHLGRSEHLYTILPAALYRICKQYDMDTICDGVLCIDDRRAVLSLEDKLLCGRAKEKLYYAQGEMTHGWIFDGSIPVASCPRLGKCEAAKNEVKQDVVGIMPRIRALDKWPQRWNDKFCRRCELMAKRMHQTGRIRVWDALPGIFDFVSWNDLRLLEEQKVYL